MRIRIDLKYLFILMVFFYSLMLKSQKIGNYVTNGDFEEYIACTSIPFHTVKGWRSIDSAYFSGVFYSNTCMGTVPYASGGFQYPHTKDGYAMLTLLCLSPHCSIEYNRGYCRNRLKSNLTKGQTYCVKFWISILDNSSYAIDAIGAYFGDGAIDKIKKESIPLIYLLPQVVNTTSNIITDTLNWTLISGTFVATGNEKHLVIGNFKSNSATNKILINPNSLPNVFCDITLDDVSCIPLDLPAYAGPDKSCKIGDSVYIGRERDFAIDPGCTWYKLPNMAVPIATAASGLYVKPVVTTTYVVKQILDCSALKWDTVVVYADLLSLESLEGLESLKVRVQGSKLVIGVQNGSNGLNVQIVDMLGKVIFEKTNL